MDLGDLRRISVTSMVAAGVLLLWALFLGLHHTDQFTWGLPEGALGWFGITAWLSILLVIMAVLVGVAGLLTFAIRQAPPGYARGKVRQVQCGDCKAVFFVHDSGHRPLTHECPSCKALGVYDGRTPPVGRPPRPKQGAPRQLGLTCHNCEHHFKVEDDGHRPLRVDCPKCKAVGRID